QHAHASGTLDLIILTEFPDTWRCWAIWSSIAWYGTVEQCYDRPQGEFRPPDGIPHPLEQADRHRRRWSAGPPPAITGRCGSAPTWCWTVASSPIETVPRGPIPSWSLISPPSRRVPRGTRSRVEPGPRPWHNRPLYVPRPALYPLQARH